MNAKLFLAVTALGLTASIMPLHAHHSEAAQYDLTRTISIQGTVTRIEWLNPHAHFWAGVQDPNGTVSSWEFELPAPNAMRLRANIGRDFLKQGEHVTMDVWRAKDGSMLAHVSTLTMPEGRVFNFPHWGVRGVEHETLTAPPAPPASIVRRPHAPPDGCEFDSSRPPRETASAEPESRAPRKSPLPPVPASSRSS